MQSSKGILLSIAISADRMFTISSLEMAMELSMKSFLTSWEALTVEVLSPKAYPSIFMAPFPLWQNEYQCTYQ